MQASKHNEHVEIENSALRRELESRPSLQVAVLGLRSVTASGLAVDEGSCAVC